MKKITEIAKIMVKVIDMILMVVILVGEFMLISDIFSMINTINAKNVDGRVDTYKLVEYSNGKLEYNLEYVEEYGKVEFHIGF